MSRSKVPEPCSDLTCLTRYLSFNQSQAITVRSQSAVPVQLQRQLRNHVANKGHQTSCPGGFQSGACTSGMQISNVSRNATQTRFRQSNVMHQRLTKHNMLYSDSCSALLHALHALYCCEEFYNYTAWHAVGL